MQFQLVRFHEDERQTLGVLSFQASKFFTIELPWRLNATNISRIPAGTYPLKLIKMPDGTRRVRIQDVPMRTLINIEVSNKAEELLGCVAMATGARISGYKCQIVDSKNAYDVLLEALSRAGDTALHTIEIIDPR